jgi:hypothetical protein
MWRRNRPTAAVEALMDRNDRVVSWATAGDQVVVASRLGLWWPTATGHRLIGWQFIDKAVWDSGRLTVIEADVVDDVFLLERRPVTIELTEPRDLPPTVRKRIESSVRDSELVAIPGGSARFVARKVPGRDGLTWWCRLEDGLSPEGEVRKVVESVLDDLRARSEPVA